jgi:O-antigen/teichoic acid export membrane protein
VSGSGYFIRGASALGVAQLFTWAASAVLVVMVPRYLGDVELGKFAFAAALVALAGLVADLGTGTYLMKEVARDRSRASPLLAGALMVRVPLGVAVAGLVVAVVHLGDYDPLTRQVVGILAWNVVLGTVCTLALSLLQGAQNMTAYAALPAAGKVVNTGLALAALLAGGGSVGLAQASVASSAFNVVATGVVLLRVLRIRPRATGAGWREVLLGGLPFFTWQASLLIYGEIDKVLLGLMTSDAVVGWYAAAYRIIGVPIFLPTIVMTVVFPSLAAAATSEASFSDIARRSLGIVVMACAPMALGIMLLADRIVDVLGYPSTFDNSVVPMILLAPTIALTGVGMIVGTALQARGQQRRWAMTGVAAAVLNPLLNVVAIPWTQAAFGNGGIGAAAATAATETFMIVVGLRLLPSTMLDAATGRAVLKTCLACMVMAPAVWLTREGPILVPLSIGAVAYGLMSLGLGMVSVEDARSVYASVAGSRYSAKEPEDRSPRQVNTVVASKE